MGLCKKLKIKITNNQRLLPSESAYIRFLKFEPEQIESIQLNMFDEIQERI